MKKQISFGLAAACSFLLLASLACASPVQLFATRTPTNTATYTFTSTPTKTLTPTNTPTRTPVPPPPFNISSCVFQEDCPEAVFVGDYVQGGLVENVSTTVVFPFTDSVRLNTGWCTSDEATLTQNMKQISFIFDIDGISYLDYATITHGFSAPDNNNNTMPCMFIGATLSNFRLGDTHQIAYGYTFAETVNDGFSTYAPFTTKYIVNLAPGLPPTATPVPTATPTPRPLPTIPYHSPTPACSPESSIFISNTTGGVVTIILSGPAYYSFNLTTGDNTLHVCGGSYSYTAYGCGGASDTGTINSGESHEFYCQ